MYDVNFLEISREALDYNARTVTEYVGVPVIGVLKCDGYGVSLKEAAWAWQKAGVTMFAVSQPGEALALRQAGFREDILLMCPVADAGMLNCLLVHNIILTVTGSETARFYCLHADHYPIRVHVAVDTGMGRFGVRWSDEDQLKDIYSINGLCFEGIFSHFSSSFEKRYRRTQVQLSRFLTAVKTVVDGGRKVGMRHIANSCAALRFPQTRLDGVRIGSALVGRLCAPVPVSLRQAAVFKAQVVDRKFFQRGDTTGYASVCKLRRAACAAVVAVGSADGFGMMGMPEPFRLRDLAAYLYSAVRRYVKRPYVTYGDQRLYLLGRIGSQYTLFDTAGTDIRPGAYVTARVPLMLAGHKRKFR